jgi:hypothetical protein
VGQRFSRDKASKPKGGEVQSGVALTYGCTEELLFFGSERRRGIAAMCYWRLEGWARTRRAQSLQQPAGQIGDGDLIWSAAVLPGVYVSIAVNSADADDVATAAAHIQSRAEFSRGVLQMNAWTDKVQVLTRSGAYPLGGRQRSVLLLELAERAEAAVIAVDVEHNDAGRFASSECGLANGACAHQARMTTRDVVACLTPRGTSSGMGCFAGLWQSGRPQAHRPPFVQYTGSTARLCRACANAAASFGLDEGCWFDIGYSAPLLRRMLRRRRLFGTYDRLTSTGAAQRPLGRRSLHTGQTQQRHPPAHG